MKYRSIPTDIDAIEWTGTNLREIIDFTGHHWSEKIWTWDQYEQIVKNHGLKIYTFAGSVIAPIGSFIIKGDGEFYPCPPDVFEIKYKSVEDILIMQPNVIGESNGPDAGHRYLLQREDGTTIKVVEEDSALTFARLLVAQFVPLPNKIPALKRAVEFFAPQVEETENAET